MSKVSPSTPGLLSSELARLAGVSTDTLRHYERKGVLPKPRGSDDGYRRCAHIASMFADGNFEIPMFVHDQTPPGVPEMERLRAAISYKYEETKAGGRVRISSHDGGAVAAVHSFLRFQIVEHKTGDRLEARR